MKAESYLEGARSLKFKIELIEEDRRDILEAMTAIRSTSDYSDRVQTSPQGDGLERKVIKYMERLEKLDSSLERKAYALAIRRHNIRQKVGRMKDGQSRRFIIDYYLNCKSWEEIFDEYAIEPDYHMKRKAIRDFEKLEKEEKSGGKISQ